MIFLYFLWNFLLTIISKKVAKTTRSCLVRNPGWTGLNLKVLCLIHPTPNYCTYNGHSQPNPAPKTTCDLSTAQGLNKLRLFIVLVGFRLFLAALLKVISTVWLIHLLTITEFPTSRVFSGHTLLKGKYKNIGNFFFRIHKIHKLHKYFPVTYKHRNLLEKQAY